MLASDARGPGGDVVGGDLLEHGRGRPGPAAGGYAEQWQAGRTVESRTAEKTTAILRTHVPPRWEEVPLSRIDHLGVQAWVAELAERRSPATVTAAFRVLAMILDTAVRARLLPVNPCDGVRLPRVRTDAAVMRTIARDDFHTHLLPAVPDQ